MAEGLNDDLAFLSSASFLNLLKPVYREYLHAAVLPSPETLFHSAGPQATDNTKTLRDLELIIDWYGKKLQVVNADVITYDQGVATIGLEDKKFDTFIENTFSTAYDGLCDFWCPPELRSPEQVVLWYYVGHGLSKRAAEGLRYSSTPCLDRVNLNPKYCRAAEAVDEFVTEDRRVKGGELCLHKVGFCNIDNLVKPFYVAVKTKLNNYEARRKDSENSEDSEDSKKKNHLVVILDSCFSGTCARELKDLKNKINEKDPIFLKENSITIQTACGTDEGTFGGYFTPSFVYLNNPENAKLLNELKAEWENMTDEERNQYKALQLPSPMVVTTLPQSGDVTMELTVQEFKITLFQDPGFFKFCSIKVYQHQDENLLDAKDRVLNPTLTEDFMSSQSFTVLDYKLKTLVTGPHAGTPMGLFLLEDPKNPAYAVCAHIHFQIGNTNIHRRINLVHHKKPPVGSVLYLEDRDGLSHCQILIGTHKVPVLLDVNAAYLVQVCRTYVESKEPGRWNDVSQWNMKGIDLGVNGLFRVEEQLNQRSAMEDSYLEQIKNFDLPEAADNSDLIV